ncbi:MAG: DUF6624 domain-containing protein [Winogradskyella arenosi]
MKKITLLLFLIIISFSTNAQNEIKKKLTSKIIDSLGVEFISMTKRIDIKKSQPPKQLAFNDNTDVIKTKITLSEECGILASETIEKYGWLSISQVGKSINNNLGLILGYANDSIKNKYKSLIKVSVLKGESNPTNYARLIDGLLVYNGELQLYGSIVGPDIYSDEFKMRVYHISEPEYVNQRRREIGLNTIQDYLQLYDINWEIPQKEK